MMWKYRNGASPFETHCNTLRQTDTSQSHSSSWDNVIRLRKYIGKFDINYTQYKNYQTGDILVSLLIIYELRGMRNTHKLQVHTTFHTSHCSKTVPGSPSPVRLTTFKVVGSSTSPRIRQTTRQMSPVSWIPLLASAFCTGNSGVTLLAIVLLLSYNSERSLK